MKVTANHLRETIKKTLPLLRNIAEQTASAKPAPDKWSHKEIIGHLIDSANNNVQKFVRTMAEKEAHMPPYEQDWWVSSQHYNEEKWEQLLNVWVYMNQHVAHIMEYIPDTCLHNTIIIGNSNPFTLEFIVKDYAEHLKHHLLQILPEASFLSNSFKMVY